MTADTATHILPRTGDTPLKFNGTLIANVSGRTPDAKADRWFEIAIYEVDVDEDYDGVDYVVSVSYQSSWHRDEKPAHYVNMIEADDNQEAAREIMDVFDNFDPVGPHFIGFPPLEKFRSRDMELRKRVTKQFIDLVGEIMSSEECSKRFAEEV